VPARELSLHFSARGADTQVNAQVYIVLDALVRRLARSDY
jgi:hypothetical protein